MQIDAKLMKQNKTINTIMRKTCSFKKYLPNSTRTRLRNRLVVYMRVQVRHLPALTSRRCRWRGYHREDDATTRRCGGGGVTARVGGRGSSGGGGRVGRAAGIRRRGR